MRSALFITAAAAAGMIAAVTAIAAATTANAAPPPPYDASNVYLVTRGDDGTPAGTHTLRFSGDSALLTVIAKTRATMRLLGFLNVPFIYDSQAVWADGVLLTLSSSFRQSDDGKNSWLTRIAGSDNNDSAYLTHSGARAAAPLFPTNHWNNAVLRQTVLFNTLSGNLISVRITAAGEETLTIGGDSTPAQRYNVDGDLKISLWYGGDGRWLQLQFTVLGTPYRFTYQPDGAG